MTCRIRYQMGVVGVALMVTCVALSNTNLLAQVATVEIPGLGDPGSLAAVTIDNPFDFALRGQNARRQLVVTGKYSSGQLRDLTQQATFAAKPDGLVSIASTGLVKPIANGVVEITATVDGKVGQIKLHVENMDSHIPINFGNQIVPIFTKLGCNSGGCHGKSSGQNGFKLSLLGFYPSDDYDYLVKEARGRRVFPASPERSLLLLKATNVMAHGGGQRMSVDSYEYELFRSWIEQGLPFGNEEDPTVAGIEVFPTARSMQRGSEQQLAVFARYSDGHMEDVTRMAQFEPNDPEMAEVTAGGLVRTLDLSGEVAVMVRFQSQVNVFRASIPLGVQIERLPNEENFIDHHVFNKLKVLGIPPSELSDDASFLRRSMLDITGKLPTAEQAKEFIEDKDPKKREKLIDDLLASGAYADYFANKWSSILRNKRENNNYTRGTYGFHEWIRDSFQRNKPYDEFAREILAASGEIGRNPPVAWYRSLRTPEQQLEDTAQLFLGLRIQCARCHHHPFERWSENDYYSFSAFFTRVGRKTGVNGLSVNDEPRIFHNRGVASGRNPRSGEVLKPAGLGGEPLEIEADEDPRYSLVDWMADPENPFFAKALVNRYWKHFMSRGIVEPEDDMRVTNPPTNPELLDALAEHFIKSGFDIKDLIKQICLSSTYQLSSEPNAYNEIDKQNFSRYYPKRLNAEVLYDALNQVTSSTTQFPGLPAGMRAVQLPDTAINNYFLQVFGKPLGDSPCECERSDEANLAQTLHLLNSGEVQTKLRGRANLLATDTERSHAERIGELYRWAYARNPLPDEVQLCVKHLENHPTAVLAYEDILWALINTKEFMFNH